MEGGVVEVEVVVVVMASTAWLWALAMSSWKGRNSVESGGTWSFLSVHHWKNVGRVSSASPLPALIPSHCRHRNHSLLMLAPPLLLLRRSSSWPLAAEG